MIIVLDAAKRTDMSFREGQADRLHDRRRWGFVETQDSEWLSEASLTATACHINVAHMRTTTIRELKHETSTVLSWVAGGETVEVRRYDQPVAILSPPQRRLVVRRPDFGARMKVIYGKKLLRTTATDMITDARGDS